MFSLCGPFPPFLHLPGIIERCQEPRAGPGSGMGWMLSPVTSSALVSHLSQRGQHVSTTAATTTAGAGDCEECLVLITVHQCSISSSRPKETPTRIRANPQGTEVTTGGMADLGGQGVRTGDTRTTILTPGGTGATMTRRDTARARPRGTGTAGIMTRRSTIMTRRTTTDPWPMTDPGGPGPSTGNQG